MNRTGAVVVAVAIALGACRPSSVGEAEAKGDVAWLDAEGSPAAVDALGRLADANEKAVAVLAARAKFDDNAYMAAWQGVKRAKAWANDLMHAGLQDPTRAEAAARAVDPRDAGVAAFVADVEASFSRLSSGGMTPALAGVLAGAGAPAHDAIVRRLADKATRGAECVAISGPASSADARATLRSVPTDSRDADACVSAVVTLAAIDDPMLAWVAKSGEPGLLGAAGNLGAIECTRLHLLWVNAINARTGPQLGGLSVPLAAAVKRCPAQMDGVLADALRAKPESQPMVIGALDPFSADDATLKATCATLPLVAKGTASAIVKERAADALAQGCKAAAP